MVARSNIRNATAAFGMAAALLATWARAGAATDPCTLLAASEAQTFVGPLATPPFRADDNGAANKPAKPGARLPLPHAQV